MENKKEDKDFFLKRAELSGYKSIKDVKIDFDKGLNIIIGKNAAGKTNFLTFLDKMLGIKYDSIALANSQLFFNSKFNFEIKASHEIGIGIAQILKGRRQEDFFNNDGLDENISISLRIGEEERNQYHSEKDLINSLKNKNINFTNSFIKHGIPEEFELIKNPLSFKIGNDGFSHDLLDKFNNKNLPKFLIGFIGKLIVFNLETGRKNQSILTIKKSIETSFSKIDSFKNDIIRFSPIEDFRLNENVNIFHDKKNNEFTINNLFIEFFIEGAWHPYSNLSDGTKRLFYLIAEVAYNPPSSYFFDESGGELNSRRIILLEEPELGIHPHQLMNLMDFIREQSRTKQIIITTHSPLVLDVLEQDELHKIIIAENSEKGTQFKHLTQAEIKKAEFFMKEEAYLSDYWKYFDLEK